MQPHCPPKTACKTADTLMPGVKSELQPKKANRHTPNGKLLVKTKTLLTFGMTLKNYQLKKPEANSLLLSQAVGFGLFYLAVFKVIPKVKSVFIFTSSFRWTVWRFAFFGCGSLFIPGINVSAGLQAVFGGQCGGILLQKLFRVGHS